MKRTFKKMVAAIIAVATMYTFAVGMPASAYINRYSTYYSPTNNSVEFGVYVTNQSGYVSSFNHYGALYNNVTNTMYGSTTSLGNQCAVGNDVQVTLRGNVQKSNMPDHTRCEQHVSCYYGISIPTYGTPYETFIGNTYYNK